MRLTVLLCGCLLLFPPPTFGNSEDEHAIETECDAPEQLEDLRQRERLQRIIVPLMVLQGDPLRDCLLFVRQKAIEFDFEQPDPTLKGFDTLIPTEHYRDDDYVTPENGIGSLPIRLKLENASIWEALILICDQAGLIPSIDQGKLVIRPGPEFERIARVNQKDWEALSWPKPNLGDGEPDPFAR